MGSDQKRESADSHCRIQFEFREPAAADHPLRSLLFSDHGALFEPVLRSLDRGCWIHLATTKGYTRLGTARAGSNVFYIRNDRLPQFADRIVITRAVGLPPSANHAVRTGGLTLLSREARSSAIGKCEVVNTVTGERGPLESFGELFSADWRDAMLGRLR